MTFASDLENKVKDYLDGDYEVSEVGVIPSVDEVAFGKKSKKIKLCAFCIDMRNSSDLLFVHEKQTSGKIHKAFLTVISQTVLEVGGEIRSFNGDGLLAFWPANYKQDISDAVKCAMTIKYLLDVMLSSYFEKYDKIDFGIGIDWGDVYIVRAGIPRNLNNNDLVFIGPCVNFATAIANQASHPKHIEISQKTYENLNDDQIYSTKEGMKIDMWDPGHVEWNGKDFKTKLTSWYWTIN